MSRFDRIARQEIALVAKRLINNLLSSQKTGGSTGTGTTTSDYGTFTTDFGTFKIASSLSFIFGTFTSPSSTDKNYGVY